MNTSHLAANRPPLRAIIYTRVSKDATGEQLAVTRQHELCGKLSELRGYVVVGHESDNSISASNGAHRPGWASVLNAIEAGLCDVVVAYHLDRITRRTRDLLDLIDLIEKHHVGVATVSGDLDLTSSMGQMLATIVAAVAANEVKHKGQRQRDANLANAKNGVPHRSGNRPFGYMLSRDRASWDVVETEAIAIQVAARQVMLGISLHEITRQWNDAGFQSSWANDTVQKPWSVNGVRAVLMSPKYVGDRVYRGEVVGTWPGETILDRETHLAVRRYLTNAQRLPQNRISRGRTATTLLTGIARCGVCDGTVSGARAWKGPSYFCTGNHNGHILRTLADKYVERLMIGLLSDPDIIKRLVPSGDENLDELRVEQAELSERLAAVTRLFMAGDMTEAELKLARGEHKVRLAEIEAALAASVTTASLAGLSFGKPEIEGQWHGLSLARQRSLVREFMDIVIVKGNGKRKDPQPLNERVQVEITI